MKENVDYELIPNENESWDVRILTGDFIETLIAFDVVALDEKAEQMKFDFSVKYTPTDDVTSENHELQLVAADILFDVLENNMGGGDERDKL